MQIQYNTNIITQNPLVLGLFPKFSHLSATLLMTFWNEGSLRYSFLHIEADAKHSNNNTLLAPTFISLQLLERDRILEKICGAAFHLFLLHLLFIILTKVLSVSEGPPRAIGNCVCVCAICVICALVPVTSKSVSVPFSSSQCRRQQRFCWR